MFLLRPCPPRPPLPPHPTAPIPTRIGRPPHRRGRPHPHRAPPHPRPHADRLRQTTGRHAAAAHLRDQPRRRHAALRHHRHRRNPRTHHPRASRRRARGQADQPPDPRAGHAGHPDRPIPSPAARCQPGAGSAGAGEPRIARLPTPGDIAAEVRCRPIGAVIADICRDLGIVPSNPLWRELSRAIISYGGNLTTLVEDIAERFGLSLTRPPAAVHPGGPPPFLPSTVVPGTGPP